MRYNSSLDTKGKTSCGKTSQNREELEPTLSQAPESFCGYVILFYPRIHKDAVLRDSAWFPCSRHPLVARRGHTGPRDAWSVPSQPTS